MASRNAQALPDAIEEFELHIEEDEDEQDIQKVIDAATTATKPTGGKLPGSLTDTRYRARSGKKRSKLVVKSAETDLESGKKKLPPHPPPPTVAPLDEVNWFSKWTWHWCTSLVFLSYRSPPLIEEDVWPLPKASLLEESTQKLSVNR
jgi:hypothetical protein